MQIRKARLWTAAEFREDLRSPESPRTTTRELDICIQLLEFSTSVWKHGPGNSPQDSRPKHSRLAGEHAVLREGTKVRLRKKPEKPEDCTVLATGFMYGACAGAVHAPPTSGRGAHLQARPLCSCKPSQLPDSLALYPAPIFSMYSLTNKPFKQTILCRNHCFSGPALHSRGEEPRIPCRSLDSDVSQTERWIFPEVTEKLHHVAEGKAVSDKTWAKSFDSSLPLRCPRIHWQVGVPSHCAKLALDSLSSKPRGCFYFALHGKEYTESKGENLFQMKWEKGFLLRQGLV